MFGFGPPPPEDGAPADGAPADASQGPTFSFTGKRVDQWGVTYVGNAEAGFGQLPEPGNYILQDIRDWKKVLVPKKPEVMTESAYKDMVAKAKPPAYVDLHESAAVGMAMFGPFQQLMAFMGFNEGLAAMYEEPEEVYELFDWMCDLYEPMAKYMVEYSNIDIFGMGDDSATRYNPFVSVDMYDRLLKPFYLRQSKYAMERGIPAEFHNCGRCEDYIPSMMDFGVKLWDPAQTDNDLVGIKQKYRGKWAVLGGFDFQVPLTWPEVSEEEVREQVRAAFAKFAPGGGWGFMGRIMTAAGDPLGDKYNGWLMDEVYTLADDYYAKH
jgi:uroporphyrinogen-III decarboxylase